MTSPVVSCQLQWPHVGYSSVLFRYYFTIPYLHRRAPIQVRMGTMK